MTLSRKPQVWLATFCMADKGIIFKCPHCCSVIGVGLQPHHAEGFAVDDETGLVHPIFVCPRVDETTKKWCMFEGHIKLTIQVRSFEHLITEEESEEDLA